MDLKGMVIISHWLTQTKQCVVPSPIWPVTGCHCGSPKTQLSFDDNRNSFWGYLVLSTLWTEGVHPIWGGIPLISRDYFGLGNLTLQGPDQDTVVVLHTSLLVL